MEIKKMKYVSEKINHWAQDLNKEKVYQVFFLASGKIEMNDDTGYRLRLNEKRMNFFEEVQA